MSEVIAKILPVILLIGLGYFLRWKQVINSVAISEMKKAVINIFLPAVLFVTFVDMELQDEYLLVFVAIFVLLILLFLIGILINKIPKVSHPLLPFALTATTFGLLGLSLYETVFGSENLIKMSIIGVGHELFIWFVYITLMKIRLNNEKFNLKVIMDFIKSPLIIAVVSGLALNMLGLSHYFHDNALLSGFFTTLKYLASISTPLILIIVGYGLVLNRKYMEKSIQLIILRLVVMLSIGYLFKWLVLDNIINDQFFDYAYFTFLILPPPMSLPIFAGKYSTKENSELLNNMVVLNTIICIIAFVAFTLIIL
ncbi:AEC family transporter [Vallitalea okinawensis]|uniref:AEC family transporter n=1 Tax=Vallitalea okinawensis TaxID=2078660 RepID=UPI000CFACB1D|nr:AEC family transporter [Vallitalea okinawensis]